MCKASKTLFFRWSDGILKALGVSDSDMLRSWGDDIFNANRQVYTGDEIDKLYSKLYMD